MTGSRPPRLTRGQQSSISSEEIFQEEIEFHSFETNNYLLFTRMAQNLPDEILEQIFLQVDTLPYSNILERRRNQEIFLAAVKLMNSTKQSSVNSFSYPNI